MPKGEKQPHYEEAFLQNGLTIIGIVSLIELKYVFSTPAAPGRHPIPRDRATAPSPTHTAALAIPGERTGVAAKLGERRFFKVALPETASNHYIFCFGSTVERSILDRASVESPRLCVFAFCSAVVLLYVLLLYTHVGIVGC